MLDLKSSFMRKNTLFIHSALGLGSNTIVICAYNLIVLGRKKFLSNFFFFVPPSVNFLGLDPWIFNLSVVIHLNCTLNVPFVHF